VIESIGKLISRKKFSPPKRGRGGRGVWGEFRRARAGSEAPPPARSEQKPAKKFSVPFRRNWSRAHQKCRENFFAGWRAAAGRSGSVPLKIGSDFVI
jgi:hypothetical protein